MGDGNLKAVEIVPEGNGSDSSMGDGNATACVQLTALSSVQIPLWAMVTRSRGDKK